MIGDDPESLEAVLQFIGPHEGPPTADPPGSIPHMYLDTAKDKDGNPAPRVTAAIGNMFPTAQAAVDTPGWVVRATGQPATPAQVARDWQLVSQAAPARLASFYERLTDCALTPQAMRDLFASRVREFAGQLRAHFPDCDSWPHPAQIATLDWLFNGGIGNLMGTIHYKAALYAQDWQGAADNCHRLTKTPEGELRNSQTAALYVAAKST